MTYGDVLTWLPEADTSRVALQVGGRTVTHDDLLGWAAATSRAAGPATAPSAGARVLLEPSSDDVADVADVLASALTTYAGVGSVVLCAPQVGAELAADRTRRTRLIETERVTS